MVVGTKASTVSESGSVGFVYTSFGMDGANSTSSGAQADTPVSQLLIFTTQFRF